jgi:hypothetical protein
VRTNKIPPKAVKEANSPPKPHPHPHSHAKSEQTKVQTREETKTEADTETKTQTTEEAEAETREKTETKTESDKASPVKVASGSHAPPNPLLLLSVRVDKSEDDDDNDGEDEDEDGQDEDEDDDNLSVASASPLQMTASSRLADSMDESLNSLSDHFSHHITPVKVTHSPGERSKIIRGLVPTGAEQSEVMMKKYDLARAGHSDDEEEEDEEEGEEGSVSSSSFEESEDFHEDMATLISPSSRDKVTYAIVSDPPTTDHSTPAGSPSKGKEEKEEGEGGEGGEGGEIGSRFNNLVHHNKSSNQEPEGDKDKDKDDEEEDDIGSRFDKLGNYLPPSRRSAAGQPLGTGTWTGGTQAQPPLPVLSGSLLGRKKPGAAGSSSRW